MKLIKIITISFCIIIILSQNIFAIDNILSTGADWLSTGKNEAGIGISTNILKTASSSVYNLLLTIATITAIIVGAILGIQYMTAGIDKKVEVKESLFPYIVSCIVVFGSLGIWKFTVTVMKEINPATDTTITTTQSGGGSTTKSGGGSTTHQSSSGQTHGSGGVSF